MISEAITSTTTEKPTCGNECNKTIVIDASTPLGTNIFDWQSAGWNQYNYTDDCTCILYVEVSQFSFQSKFLIIYVYMYTFTFTFTFTFAFTFIFTFILCLSRSVCASCLKYPAREKLWVYHCYYY